MAIPTQTLLQGKTYVPAAHTDIRKTFAMEQARFAASPHPAPQTERVPLTDERAAFQAFYEARFGVPMNSRTKDSGEYGDYFVQCQRNEWKAANNIKKD